MALDHEHGQLVKELVDEIVQALMTEYNVLLGESARVKNLLSEAAQNLRQGFKDIDSIVKDVKHCEVHQDFGSAYQRIVTTLQFEDIVSQIISHQMERADVTKSIMERIDDVLKESIASGEDHESTLFKVRKEISTGLTQFSGTESVMQENMTAGESELF